MRLLNISILTVLMMCLPFSGIANTRTTVQQVSTAVTLSDDVDYVITSDTPFTDDGYVDITNTEHAVLILYKLKPSKALQQLSHVRINGARAVNNVNCQLRIYNIGCMIIPYASDVKPLTVFAGKNFSGESVNDFGLENSGGYMNTLTDAKLNNRIQSFKLKRGYMVTFSTLPTGRGYSRCFIAADKDIEMAELPEILSGRISSYRIFKWNYNSKSGLANDTRSEPCAMLNVTSCYSFGLGEDRGMDTECVPHHIYEDWPSSSACGSVTYSAHLKTNNEPGNSADDHPQSVDEILNNWERLMATGMRLCSPSSHDGSLNHLRAFLDSIDARGWRCDIIDLHCYWPEGSFGSIKGWVDTYKRPVWISEWVWGASWNNNGIFGVATGSYRDNPTTAQLNQNKNAVQNICSNLNSWDYIERYFYWNSEANCSKLYRDGKLTPAGEYYASMNPGVGYNGKYEFVPTTPRQYGISDYSCEIADGKATLKWHDQNGEYNQLMEVQRKLIGGQWEVISVVQQKESAANYTFVDEDAPEGASYRVHLRDLNGNDKYTNDDIEAGDNVVDASGKTWYAGGNMIANGDFEWGMYDWNAGNGEAVSQPYFQVVPVGGYDGGPYLQAYATGGIDHEASLKKIMTIAPETDYVFSVAYRNAGKYLKISLTEDGKTESKSVGLCSTSADWKKQSFIFNSGSYQQLLIAYRWLLATAQIDKVELRQLFENRDDAVADGIEKIRQHATALKAYNTLLPELNEDLDTRLAAITTKDDGALWSAKKALDDMTAAILQKTVADSLMQVANKVADMEFEGREQLLEAMDNAKAARTAEEMLNSNQQLRTALNAFLPLTEATTQPIQPSFATSNGWEVKVGSYKGGDQRTNSVKGKSCWNAWWSGIDASQGTSQTMEVRQKVEGLEEGLYALECKAATEHYCLSDQHGYLTTGDVTMTTPSLKADYFDLPTVGNIWQTLTTIPTYVEEGGAVTIGFVGSKQGAVNNAWRAFGNEKSTGDKREGWWCATDFVLKYHPLHKATVNVNEWKTICLPYAYKAPAGTKMFRIAGILSDHSCVCLEPIEVVEAGQPAVYFSEVSDIVFYEYGEKAKSPAAYAGENNLRGFFATTAKAPKGCYMLTGNGWTKVADDRPTIESYTAIIYKLDGMEEIASWSGMTMPLFDSPDAVGRLDAGKVSHTSTYTIGGQPTSQSRGIVIEVKDNTTRKIIKK